MREPRPDWSPLGVNFKILDEHPHLFNIQVPPPREILQTDFFFQISTNVPATRAKMEEPVSTRSTVFVVFAKQDMQEKLVKQVMSPECCLLYYVHYKVTRLSQNWHSLIGCESHATCETPTFFCVQGPSITANKISQTWSLRKRWVQQTAFTV